MNPQILTAFIIMLVWNGNALFAQPDKLRFERITIEQGLSDNNALCARKDSKGYMWFGTWNGLNKYDGYTVTSYFTDPDDPATISYNTIFSIYEDSKSTLWMTVAGANVSTYDLNTQKFKRFVPDKSKGPLISITASRAIIEDTSGVMWIGNSNGELGRFDAGNGKFYSWSYDDSVFLEANLQRAAIRGVDNFYKDEDGGIWIGSYNGLYHYEPSGKTGHPSFTRYVHHSGNVNSLSNDRVTCIYETKQKIMWIGTANGLNRFDRKTNSFAIYTHKDSDSSSLTNNFISGISEDKNGDMWIGTRNGLNLLDHTRPGSFIHFYHDPDDPTSLSNNFIFSQFMDSSEVLWLATLGGGVSKLDLNQRQIQVYRNKRSDKNSLSDNKVTAILEDNEGLIWIGTAFGGVNVWDRKSNRFTHYTSDSLNTRSIAGDQVGAILQDSDGDVWIGTGKRNAVTAISRFDRTSSTFVNYYFNYKYSGPPSGNGLMSLYQSRNGTIWIGTSHGYIQFDKRTGTHIYFPFDPGNPDGVSDYWVNCFYEDKKGNMWMGPNSNALNKLDIRTRKVVHYLHVDGDTNTISSTIVKCMFRDSKGNVWFGTRSGGLALLHEDNETFSDFTTRDGLPSNTVFSITEDNDNNLWLATNKGLCMFDYVKRKAVTYTTADGLPGNHFESVVGSGVPACKTRDGRLLFGGPNGLIVFDPKKIVRVKPPGEVVITQFKLFDRQIQGVADTIVLRYNENFVSFEFASLNYVNPTENQYAYLLKGVDNDWVYTGSHRLATYTNLAPGRYTFYVKASSDNEHWREIKKPVMLTILPPWWKTWWFYTIVALAAVSAVYGVFKYGLNQKIKLYSVRNRIHRDLHDDVGATLSSVKAYSEILKDNPDKPLIADLIIENANEMIMSLEDISWATNPQFDNLGSLVAKIKKFAIPLLHAKNIEFNLHVTGIDEMFQLPGEVRRNILLIVKEALNNVYKYSMARKCVVSFSRMHRIFGVTVSDDGVGISVVVQGTGNGIKNMRNRTTELNGKMQVESVAGKGTTLKIFIRYPFVFTPLKSVQ